MPKKPFQTKASTANRLEKPALNGGCEPHQKRAISIENHAKRHRRCATSGKFRRTPPAQLGKTLNQNMITTSTRITESHQSHSIEKVCISCTKKSPKTKISFDELRSHCSNGR
jgi:hypothetical protein